MVNSIKYPVYNLKDIWHVSDMSTVTAEHIM